MKALTIGIAGGSGSGKTTIAQKIIKGVGEKRISYLEMDAYYRDLSHLPLDERALTNFDHPAAFDTELFVQHIDMLRSGMDVEKPEYDFTIHSRKRSTVRVKARPVVFLEGILLFENQYVREHIDIKIYVETPSDLRFIRRLTRDLSERGRTTDSVVKQYYKTVRPMHQAFVEPSREYADIIVPWQGYNEVAIEMVTSRIEQSLAKREEEESFIVPPDEDIKEAILKQ
ncbi:MAG TPA: uridine kinase [bacterium]|nr:uridine kinase [Myxococcales bacterium]OQA62273.1 MAG: Uridine kinase [bacterium ADurb.Bin270]HPW45133.1 uridine kinase [bacterium]HQC50313.1 uridine kinase [bacterium]